MSKNYAIFHPDDFIFFGSPEIMEKYLIRESEAELAIELVDLYIAEHQALFANSVDRNPNIDLKNYIVQLSGYIDSNKDLMIQLNCIKRGWVEGYDWNKKLFFIDDGGNSYFQVDLNFSQSKIVGLRVNGLA